jgi:hypothetical protein
MTQGSEPELLLVLLALATLMLARKAWSVRWASGGGLR